MNALLRRLAVTALVPLSLWSAPASAHPTVVDVGGPRSYAPPPVRVEYRSQIPCERAVWISGSWSWTAYGWQWTPGYWQQPVVYQAPRPVYYGYPVAVQRPAYGYERHEAEEHERHEHDRYGYGYGYRGYSEHDRGYSEHDRGYGEHDRGYGDQGYRQQAPPERPRPPSDHR